MRSADWAALEAVGALSNEEAAPVRDLLDCAGEEVRSEREDFHATAAELGLTAEPTAPPAGLKTRLLDSLDDEPALPRGTLLLEKGLLISRAADMEWSPHPVPGMATKLLHLDQETQIHTSIVRMDPGSTYPGHVHAVAEELLVLQGDALVHGQLMRPGDYCRADPDSTHQPTTTENGVVLLVRASLQDKMIL